MPRGRPPKNRVDWREVNKNDAITHVQTFYNTSWNWRNQAYHAAWDRRERNYHNIYDPTAKSKKESWQATMFIPMTVTVVETIASALVKLLMGGDRVITVEPREMGDELQAELRTNLMDYETEQSGFVPAFAAAMKEALIYGSGFIKLYWKKTREKRRIHKEQRAGFLQAAELGIGPGDIVGFEEQVEEILAEDHAQFDKIHIRDIFLEPNSTDMKRVLHRSKVTYAELLDMANQGALDKKSVDELLGIFENDKFESDISTVKGERSITDPNLNRPKYDKNHTIWEYWGLIPRRWIDLDLSAESEKGNEIVPGKIMVASGHWYLGSEENPLQFMHAPFFKANYIDVGDSYGKGAAEIIEGLQSELNEIRNQRVDNVSLIMNKMFAVLEKNLVDGRIISMPGGMIRVRAGGSSNVDDVRKAIMPIETPDVALSAYKETLEIERQSQEATGANRVTTGTAGLVNDQNRTLGGMQLIRQAAFDRFTVTAFLVGATFVKELGKSLFSLIYQNRGPESIRRILGEMPIEVLPGQIVPKWKTYRPLPPHEVMDFYDFKVVDIFGKENEAQQAQQIISYIQVIAGLLPQFDPKPALTMVGKKIGLSEDQVLSILGPDVGPQDSPLAQGVGQPSQPRAQAGRPPAQAPPPSQPSPAGPNLNAEPTLARTGNGT